MKAATATLAGSVLGGFLASICCIVPLTFAMLGLSGAAFALRFEPWRPCLLVVTYGLLAGAFYVTYRPTSTACAPGDICAVPTNRSGRVALWIATIVVLLTTAFPYYSPYLF